MGKLALRHVVPEGSRAYECRTFLGRWEIGHTVDPSLAVGAARAECRVRIGEPARVGRAATQSPPRL